MSLTHPFEDPAEEARDHKTIVRPYYPPKVAVKRLPQEIVEEIKAGAGQSLSQGGDDNVDVAPGSTCAILKADAQLGKEASREDDHEEVVDHCVDKEAVGNPLIQLR